VEKAHRREGEKEVQEGGWGESVLRLKPQSKTAGQTDKTRKGIKAPRKDHDRKIRVKHLPGYIVKRNIEGACKGGGRKNGMEQKGRKTKRSFNH